MNRESILIKTSNISLVIQEIFNFSLEPLTQTIHKHLHHLKRRKGINQLERARDSLPFDGFSLDSREAKVRLPSPPDTQHLVSTFLLVITYRASLFPR